MRHLDHVAAQVNPFLIVIAFRLAVIDLTSLSVLIARTFPGTFSAEVCRRSETKSPSPSTLC
jgi:hypothetical protein